jgi:hypothetical protein
MLDPDMGPSYVEWVANVTITVDDQFGTVLGANWNSLVMTEIVNGGGAVGFTSSPTTLSTGTFTDPVTISDDAGNALSAGNIVKNTGSPSISITGSPVTQYILGNGVQIDGVNNRTENVLNNVFTVTNSH